MFVHQIVKAEGTDEVGSLGLQAGNKAVILQFPHLLKNEIMSKEMMVFLQVYAIWTLAVYVHKTVA